MPSNQQSNSPVQTLAEIRAQIAQGNDATRKRRKLDKTEKNRAKKLKDITKRLKEGGHVQNRMLQTWLTEEEFASIQAEWEHEKNSRVSIQAKPTAVTRYEALLKQADFLHSRSLGYSDVNNKNQAAIFDGMAVSAYEDALASLEEDIVSDRSLQQWFDRGLDFEAGSMLDFNPASMPRVITSRSPMRQTGGVYEKRTISEIKLSVVQQALEVLIFEDDACVIKSPKVQKLIVNFGEDFEV